MGETLGDWLCLGGAIMNAMLTAAVPAGGHVLAIGSFSIPLRPSTVNVVVLLTLLGLRVWLQRAP